MNEILLIGAFALAGFRRLRDSAAAGPRAGDRASRSPLLSPCPSRPPPDPLIPPGRFVWPARGYRPPAGGVIDGLVGGRMPRKLFNRNDRRRTRGPSSASADDQPGGADRVRGLGLHARLDLQRRRQHLRGHGRALRPAPALRQPGDRPAQPDRADRPGGVHGQCGQLAATTPSSRSTRTTRDVNPALKGHLNISTGVSRSYAKGNLIQFWPGIGSTSRRRPRSGGWGC